jgi:hypothetical protein
MAISCVRTATHTRSWVARASRCPVENLGRTNRSNGGMLHGNQEESRQEKETLSGRCSSKISAKASREKHLAGGFFVEESNVHRLLVTGKIRASSPDAITLDTINLGAGFFDIFDNFSSIPSFARALALRDFPVLLPHHIDGTRPHARRVQHSLHHREPCAPWHNGGAASSLAS